MHRPLPTVLGPLAAAAALALAAAAPATAQAPTTLSFRELDKGGTFHFIDVAPKTKLGKNGPKRFSVGDGFISSSPLASDAGKRIGTLHAKCDVVKGGRTFESVILDCDGVFGLPQGKLFASAQFAGPETSGVITGGTASFAGARGTFASKEHKGYSQDTVTFVP